MILYVVISNLLPHKVILTKNCLYSSNNQINLEWQISLIVNKSTKKLLIRKILHLLISLQLKKSYKKVFKSRPGKNQSNLLWRVFYLHRTTTNGTLKNINVISSNKNNLSTYLPKRRRAKQVIKDSRKTNITLHLKETFFGKKNSLNNTSKKVKTSILRKDTTNKHNRPNHE